jgi:hypothetical protein
MFGEEGQDLTS